MDWQMTRGVRAKDHRRRMSVVLRQYMDWLVEYRNLSEESVRKHRRYLLLFLEWMSKGRGALRPTELSHEHIEGFVIAYASTHGVASREWMQAVMRVFLRFCHAKEYTERDLSAAVPTIRGYKLAKVPPTLDHEDIQRILEHIDRSTAAGRRDYAMIQMLYEYGVRSKQVRTLRLSDIDWRRSEIRFPVMKHGKEVCLPLTPTVGESLLDYLRYGRPQSPEQEVFLAAYPPFQPFRYPSYITRIITHRSAAAGFAPGKVTPHTFRHAFASRMLKEGQSLKSIADLLGHRRLQTTFIYTKVDFQALSQVPLAWPEDKP